MNYLISNQIAIQIALDIKERKWKSDVQLGFNDNLYFRGYESLNMPSIFDRFWPILAIGKKKFVKKTLNDFTNLE